MAKCANRGVDDQPDRQYDEYAALDWLEMQLAAGG
jgi:hypothetical protein